MTNGVDAFLDTAVAAARDRADDGVTDGATTRLRLRESLGARSVAPKRRPTLIAAVLASLFGSTAFAYYAATQPAWSPLRIARSPAPVAATTPAPAPGARRPPAIAAEASPAVVIAAPALAPEVEATPTAPTSIAPPARRVATVPAPTRSRSETPRLTGAPPAPMRASPPAIEPPAPARGATAAPPAPTRSTIGTSPRTTTRDTAFETELASYRVAHEAHFRGTDPAAALGAWDAYLARYPNGRLAPEARYDRALVLVKLARYRDAEAALAPFAAAPVGSYRQREAAQLLAAIRAR